MKGSTFLLHVYISCIHHSWALLYNESRAVLFANLAGASYCSSDELRDWDCGSKCDAVKDVSHTKVCSASSTQAFVALWEGKCIVSFKGTNTPGDILKDLETWHDTFPWTQCSGCQVHAGFLATYNSLRECIQTSLKELGCAPGSSIRTTGHSLGAAANALAMVDLTNSGWIIEESYDFARPRVGDEHFAEILSTTFGDRSWRITRKRDPIPLVPSYLVDLHWTHSRPEVYYKNEIRDGYEMCSDPKDHSHCSENNTIDPLYIFEHEYYMDIVIGSLSCRWWTNASSGSGHIII